MEYDIMPQQTLPNNPDVGSYDPRRKFLSTERRTTMAPMLDKQTEERFQDDREKLAAMAPNQYDPSTKVTDRRTTAAPQLDKQTEERFKMDQDKVNAPAPNCYDPRRKVVDRRNTAAPQLDKQTEERFKLDQQKLAFPAPNQYNITPEGATPVNIPNFEAQTERFGEIKEKAPAVGSYDPKTKITDRRQTMAYQFGLEKSERFTSSQNDIPGVGSYDLGLSDIANRVQRMGGCGYDKQTGSRFLGEKPVSRK